MQVPLPLECPTLPVINMDQTTNDADQQSTPNAAIIMNNNPFEYLRDDAIDTRIRAHRFISKLGYTPTVKDSYKEVNKLHKKYPDLIDAFFKRSETRMQDDFKDTGIYEVKNSNASISRVISSIHQAPLWTEWMQWFLDNLEYFDRLKPQRILDCGADTGVTTLFLAALYPEAQITGVEICENGITLAEQIKQRNGFENVTFIQSDLAEYLSENEGQFDLLNSLTCIREVFQNSDPSTAKWSLEVGSYLDRQLPVNEFNHDLSESLRKCLKNTASPAVIMERISDEKYCQEFLNNLGSAGAHVKQSDGIHFEVFGEPEFIPLLMVTFEEKPKQYSLMDALGVMGRCDAIMLQESQKRRDTHHCLLFEAISDKRLHQGMTFEYTNGSGIEYAEIWQTDTLLIGHYRNVYGMAELEYWPLSYENGAHEFLKKHEARTHGCCDHQHYSSIEEKDDIIDALKEKYSDKFGE